MSKVHQAIRRAEKEHRRDPLAESVSRGSLLKGTRNEMTAVFDKTSLSAGSQSLPEDDGGAPIYSESARIRLPVLHNAKLVALSAPKSPSSEQYRTLKTKLFQMRNDRNLRSVLVTSAAPSDGKTLTAVNLALTIAQEIEKRVLLIDCDLRRPSVHQTLGFPKTNGLADFLGSEVPSSSIVLPTSIPNLSVVPAGTIPENPAELLNTDKMRSFLSSISQEFDWVIVDSPPIVPLADAELLSALVDGTLLVVRACKTPSDSIAKAVQALKNGRILGVVFNGIQSSKKSGYYYYSYDSPKT